MSPQRPILPGLRYQMPPRPVRRSLLALTEEEAGALAKKALSQEEGAKALTGELDLVSPLIGPGALAPGQGQGRSPGRRDHGPFPPGAGRGLPAHPAAPWGGICGLFLHAHEPSGRGHPEPAPGGLFPDDRKVLWGSGRRKSGGNRCPRPWKS